MNKCRRKTSPVPFPSVDKMDGHIKGKIPGNMMAYAASRAPSPYPPLSNENSNYGPAPLKEPTRSGFGAKTLPSQMKGYVGFDANKPEWAQIQSQLKKKGE